MSMIGKTLAHYEITGQLGKGGMGEVYQAKDRKLGRDVAIKVLPEEFARDTDRVARFQREAKLLASLNHPNIAAIYGLEESGGIQFLVLELVEGEMLADRIKRGPIPVEESLKLTLQIAEALEAAHERGVIHRDLKPANIKVTPDGKVKVLDFGLAKAFAGDQEVNLSNSPTLSNAATQQGVILGTAAYMSPEQARGKVVDKRADIWAFGCLLYEMLTGQAAFQGEDITEILASVVKGGANLDLLPAIIHPRVREVLSHCLQKDLKKRFRDIGDLQFELEQILAEPSGVIVKSAPTPEFRHVTCLYCELPKDQQFSSLNQPMLAVSPDGRQLVYCTPEGICLRSMEELDAKLIRGTEGNPQQPFFSPDGQWIGYWSQADRQLKKIRISGGISVPLTDDPSIGFLSWNMDGTIIYSGTKGIMRVSANGGNPETLIGSSNETFYAPRFLPDGKSVIFTVSTAEGYKVAVQSLESGKRNILIAGDDAHYSPTGHLVYIVGKDLSAIPFDLKTLEVTGGGTPMVKDILRTTGVPQFAVSASGTLVYMPEAASEASAKQNLVWIDRNGKAELLATPPDVYHSPRISPNGTKVAFSLGTGGNYNLWIWDLVRKAMSRLTVNIFNDGSPLWIPDGRQIVFNSNRGANIGVFMITADGTGNITPLYSQPGRSVFPECLSGDGKMLLMTIATAGGGEDYDIGMLPMEGDPKWRPLLQEKYNELQPQISPNGRWMAYTSNQSGHYEVYVRPFPKVDTEQWQVSTSGGDSPLWSPDGRELFYRNGDAAMTVPVKTDPSFSLKTPKILFRGEYIPSDLRLGSFEPHSWDIRPDGKRFLMMKQSGAGTSATAGPRRINIVLNWFEELKQRVQMK
jgi:serine/threonine protein kinase